ncbi:MAG TPA: hypothetical protein VFQ85_02420 [Mycobacteriales bacterium]|jgi:hypothetical protein|nr:hypothetical protein [Mycobacteriales bacterium]
MLKKIIAATAVAGALGFVAAPAMAAGACVEIHLNINGTPVDVVQCTPPA